MDRAIGPVCVRSAAAGAEMELAVHILLPQRNLTRRFARKKRAVIALTLLTMACLDCGAYFAGENFSQGQSPPGAAAPEEVPARPLPNVPPARVEHPLLVGAGSCAASACHGGLAHAPAGLQNAYSVWIEQKDPHTAAYSVLGEARSQKILWQLDRAQEIDANPSGWTKKMPQRDARCLTCHSVHADFRAVSSAILADGVSCEACHGPAAGWIEAHTVAGWPGLGKSRYQAFDDVPRTSSQPAAMWNTKDLVSRANICVRCHVGGGYADVNHDLIAAGHPRLFFELSAFMAAMPRHWNDRLDREALQLNPQNRHPPRADEEARLWSIGQTVAGRAAVRLTLQRAEAALQHLADPQRGSAVWPELAEFDCFACHRSLHPAAEGVPLTANADAKLRPSQQPGKSGHLPWDGWYFSQVQRLANPTTPAETRAPQREILDRLRAAIEDHPDQPQLIAEPAGQLIGQLTTELFSTRTRGEVWTIQTIDRTLNGLGQLLPAESWDEAAQRYLAIVALNLSRRSMPPSSSTSPIDELILQKLSELRKRLQYEPHLRSPANFDRTQVNGNLVELKELLARRSGTSFREVLP